MPVFFKQTKPTVVDVLKCGNSFIDTKNTNDNELRELCGNFKATVKQRNNAYFYVETYAALSLSEPSEPQPQYKIVNGMLVDSKNEKPVDVSPSANKAKKHTGALFEFLSQATPTVLVIDIRKFTPEQLDKVISLLDHKPHLDDYVIPSKISIVCLGLNSQMKDLSFISRFHKTWSAKELTDQSEITPQQQATVKK